MKSKTLLFIVLALFIVAGLIPALAGYWVYGELQSRLKIELDGNYVPQLFQTAFEVHDVKFRWEDKVLLRSGDLKVGYDLISILTTQNLRVRLSSNEADIQLLGKWAQIQGVEDAALNHFTADLGIAPDGLKDIYSIQAQAPTLQFQIQKADN